MKLKRLFTWALLTTLGLVANAQNWTWTHEFTMKTSPNPVYFYNVGQEFFLKATSTYATNANEATAFKVEYKRESSQDRYYISYENDGTKYVNQNNGNQNWGTTSYGWYFDTNGSGITIRTRDVLDSNKRSISANDDGIYYPKNDKSTNATWYVISATQMNNYNRYMEVYQAAQSIGVDVSSYASANNSNAATVIANIENAIKATFTSATIDNPVNATGLIKNVGYEFKTWDYGWTNENFEEHSNDGKFVGSHIAQMWNPELVSGSIKQTVNLPQGVYILKAKITAGFDGTEQYLYAKTTAETRKAYVAGKDGDPAEYHEVMFRVLPGDNGQAEIGFVRDNIRWWTGVDDFTLQYVGETPAFTYEMGTRLDGSYLSRPAYTSTPADGIDPDHAEDGLLVVTWPNENTNDPWCTSTLEEGAKAHVTADGVDVEVDLLSHFRTSTYHNGFGLYIPNFDENKTYTVTVPANVIGYASGNADAFGKTFTKVMNEEFTINAKQSPIKDGKYFIRVAGTTKHVSRGGHYGTQAILDNYGVPVLVQTAGLTVFKFLDNNAFFGNDPGADDMYTDCFDERTRRYNLIPDDEENPTKVQFFTPARDKYLYHGSDAINGVAYEKISEGDEGDWYDFEPFTAEGYAAHLKGISDDEAQRVAERAGLAVNTREEYDQLITDLETAGSTDIWPKTSGEEAMAATYHEARNNDLPVEPVWEPAPKDLIAGGERLTLTLDEGLYCVSLNAFQQASALEGLQQNLGFRGLVYYYAKVGDVMSKDQLKSITETTGSIPTTEEQAKAALTGENYRSRILFYVPANGTEVEFGVQNPQRLGNGIDGDAGSWVAFQNLKIEKFESLDNVTLSCKPEKYGTFVAPFAVKIPEGIVVMESTDRGDKVAVKEMELTNNILPACTPVIIKNTTGTQITQNYSGANNKTESTVTDGVLTGSYVAGVPVPTGAYVLQTQSGVQAFYIVVAEKPFTNTKNRCYLNETASGAKMMVFSLGDEDFETSIEEVFNSDVQHDAKVYDLSGRRVNATSIKQGIYIVNGKKVLK